MCYKYYNTPTYVLLLVLLQNVLYKPLFFFYNMSFEFYFVEHKCEN